MVLLKRQVQLGLLGERGGPRLGADGRGHGHLVVAVAAARSDEPEQTERARQASEVRRGVEAPKLRVLMEAGTRREVSDRLAEQLRRMRADHGLRSKSAPHTAVLAVAPFFKYETPVEREFLVSHVGLDDYTLHELARVGVLSRSERQRNEQVAQIVELPGKHLQHFI